MTSGAIASQFTLGGVTCSTMSIPELLGEIRTLLSDPSIRPRSIVCVNAYIHNLARANDELRTCLNGSHIVAIDGMSVVWAGRLLGAQVKARCNMTEAFREFLCEPDMHETRAILIGGADGVAEMAAAAITSRSHCTVVGAYSGFLEDAEYTRLLAEVPDVDFVLAGMGTPRSEKLLTEVIPRVLPEAIGWHIGGGTIEFLAGVKKEAPAAFRRSGLQWLYRLSLEPRRLWRRYLLGNPAFAWHAVREIVKARAK